MGSQVVGSLISGIVFRIMDDYWYPVIMSVIMTISAGCLFLLRSPAVAETNNLRERTDSIMISALPHALETNTVSSKEDDDAIERLLGAADSQ